MSESLSLGEMISAWREYMAEDLKACDGDWKSCGFRALAVYRLGSLTLQLDSNIARSLIIKVQMLLYRWVRNHYGIDLPPQTTVGRRLVIAHQHGICIHHSAVIGDDCIIRQGVTLGAESADNVQAAPTLGARVDVGPGVVIAGAVTVGDDVRIGPNAVVIQNVKPAVVAFGNPLRMLPRTDLAEQEDD